MQTKLLLAALAANSVHATSTKALAGDRNAEVEARLLDIYTRCKAHIEGVNFEVKRGEEGNFTGRITFALEDAEDCPELDVTVKTYVEREDKSSRTETSRRSFEVEEVKSMIAGQTADMELFSMQAYPAYVVEIRVKPKDLDCGLPFDIVFDRVPNEVKCAPIFSGLKGKVFCAGTCEAGSQLTHMYDYDIEPKSWNKWACDNVISKFTPTATISNTDLGVDSQSNAVVKAFIIPGMQQPFTTPGTYEPIHWKVEFFDKGEQIGRLDYDVESNPHPPCNVVAWGEGAAAPTNTGFDLSLDVNSRVAYNCGEITRNVFFEDCKTVIAVQTEKNEVAQAKAKQLHAHSLLWADLPQKFCATVQYNDEKLGQVGSFKTTWEGNNECTFNIDSVVLSNVRQEDFSQSLQVAGSTSQSISCPQFDLNIEYWVNGELKHTSVIEKVASGAFKDNTQLPEFFGDVKVQAIMAPKEGAANAKKAPSNVVAISPEACTVKVSTTAEYFFDPLTSQTKITTKDNAVFTNHWCDLENITCTQQSWTTAHQFEVNEEEFKYGGREFANLMEAGLIQTSTYGNVDFCYQHNLQCVYQPSAKFPNQEPAQDKASLGSKDVCHIGHCTLRSIDVLDLNSVFSAPHDVLSPTYKVDGQFDIKMTIDQLPNCPELIFRYAVQFSEDSQNFQTIGTPIVDNLLTDEDIVMAVEHENDLALKFDSLREEKTGFYRVCAEILKVEPALYEKPIGACSNVVNHKPACEYQITTLDYVSTEPDSSSAFYKHTMNFEGFQNKWCGEMIATAKVTDPWGGIYHKEVQTIANKPNSFEVHQDDNFINGDSYIASVTWQELTPTKNNIQSKQAAFTITEAGHWCSPSLGFQYTWAVETESETWDSMAIKSHNFLATYSTICESPVFTIDFDGTKKEHPLPQPAWPTSSYDNVFQIQNPTARDFSANLSINTHPLNGASKVQPTEPISYVPLCYVSGVYWENKGLKYGQKNSDPTILSLALAANVQGNCGDNVSYTLSLDDAQFDLTMKGDVQYTNIQSNVDLKENLKNIELPFDGSFGHNVKIDYVVNAVNSPRKDMGTTQDHHLGQVTVADHMRCVVKVEMAQVTFGENQGEMLEAQYDLKCKIEDCRKPYGQMSLFNSIGQSSSAYKRDLREDEIADCVRDYVRVTVVVDNEPGCYEPVFKLMDTFEPAEDTAELACKPYQPVCHTNILSLTKTGHRLNFDETIAAVDLHFKLESHQDRFCGYQMVRMEFSDQNNEVKMIHELDLSEILKAKSEEGFTTTVELDNDKDITSYSLNLVYFDQSNKENPAKKSLGNVFTYAENTVCQMEIETFALQSLTKVGNTDDYIAEFGISAHVTEACRNDFEASINFIHNDQYVENFVVLDPSSIYRIEDDGAEKSIKLTIRNLTDLSGEFYGQIEMTAAGKYHIRDSASLLTSWV